MNLADSLFDMLSEAISRIQEKSQSDMTYVERKTNALLRSNEFRLIESRFRATDRNLTIRLRNHEDNRS